MDRIKKLCSYLDGCKTFADIGCDHGYCTQYMLKNGLCESAVIADISAKCLKKAETLLQSYIKENRVKSVCCNGLAEISEEVEEVLIAGMGGDEIVEILSSAFVPKKFVFQPMKNVRAVRQYLLKSGAKITVDEPFQSGNKFYFVIKGERGLPSTRYTDTQLEYGLNLNSETTKKYLESELSKKREYLKRDLNAEARTKISGEISLIEEVLHSES